MNSLWIWENSNATNEEIANCKGDYYGCEVCRHQGRCLKMLEESLSKLATKRKETRK